MTNLSISSSLAQDQVPAVRQLLQRVESADSTAAFSEQYLLGLADARLAHRHFLATVPGAPQVVGILAADGPVVELAVDPQWRRRGVATALLEAARAELGPLQVWAHGNLLSAQALAQAHGMQQRRELLVMEVRSPHLEAAAQSAAAQPEAAAQPAAAQPEAAALPEGVCLLSYPEAVARWGREYVESEWVRVNNEAFEWHPEQGGWDIGRLRRGMEAQWFDPALVLLLWDTAAEADKPRLAGFHWLKWHAQETGGDGQDDSSGGDTGGDFGEVYVVGLANDARGRGLGAPLLRAGLAALLAKGARRVILYVEADNAPAVRAYEKLGFGVAQRHTTFADEGASAD
ncbi:mycothiol synthase [Corynebacterium lizhenjunii]|uniref:Mycothiol acetyltransferase n=1 Tax=Corynebacterium lizhenjunii TaxID=2709394 RepID=A0A7T0KE17_9CORY|nr:mycothiol synthase [Corynebacterium lizhenjunii]QPK78877.1 mycothiol synthase [Corynebacterium lizhenjunii]